jgi:EmrB/QacA subfamily drug resistance transporter
MVGAGVDTGVKKIQMWVLALSSVASFMVVLDMLVVSTSLTAIQRDLGVPLSGLEWTVNAYTLSFAVLLMTAASLGERFGRRAVFVAGLGIFALASAACAFAPSAGALLVARTLQGAGAAAIMPVSLALLNAAFPPERRGWAIGIYGGFTASAVLLGPIVGGAVTEGLAWQWIFWLNVPIGLAAIPLVLLRVPASAPRAVRLDPAGLSASAAAAFLLTYSLVRPNVAVALAGLVATGLFVWWERRAPAPMLPLRLFGSRAFSSGNAVIFLLNAGLTGSIFFTAQFFQVSGHLGPLAAGLRLLPWGIAPALIAPKAGTLADRWGSRGLILLGMVLDGAGLLWLALAARPHVAYIVVVWPMILAGIGFSLAIPAVTRAVVASVAPQDIGIASGTFTTLRQLGGAFGIAIAGVAFGTPASFADGYVPAILATAAMAFAAALAATLLAHSPTARPAEVPARPRVLNPH